MICLQTVKWLQVLLFNTNYSIEHYSFICTQLNGSKYCYVSLTIQILSNLFILLNGLSSLSNNSILHKFAHSLLGIGKMVRVFANGPGDLGLIQRLKKWYLMPPCLTLSIIRYGSRVKWVNPEKGVAPFPTPWCSSYQKWSLQVTLDYGRQFYLL